MIAEIWSGQEAWCRQVQNAVIGKLLFTTDDARPNVRSRTPPMPDLTEYAEPSVGDSEKPSGLVMPRTRLLPKFVNRR
jgi:hypothetical protein